MNSTRIAAHVRRFPLERIFRGAYRFLFALYFADCPVLPKLYGGNGYGSLGRRWRIARRDSAQSCTVIGHVFGRDHHSVCLAWRGCVFGVASV